MAVAVSVRRRTRQSTWRLQSIHGIGDRGDDVSSILNSFPTTYPKEQSSGREEGEFVGARLDTGNYQSMMINRTSVTFAICHYRIQLGI